VVVEQLVRPTGLLDPLIELHPVTGQIDHLLARVRACMSKGHKSLVMTLTKRMAEDLHAYFRKVGLRSQYLHSEIKSLERIQILRELRTGEIDVLVGVNLLREGLDLPEVALVAILDADKEGFLRDAKSLMQIAGRAARNVEGTVLFYADRITDSMRKVLDESARRRGIQEEYNRVHGIEPRSIVKSVDQVLNTTSVADAEERYRRKRLGLQKRPELELHSLLENMSREEMVEMVAELSAEMQAAAEDTDYEKAAYLRDEIFMLQEKITQYTE